MYYKYYNGPIMVHCVRHDAKCKYTHVLLPLKGVMIANIPKVNLRVTYFVMTYKILLYL